MNREETFENMIEIETLIFSKNKIAVSFQKNGDTSYFINLNGRNREIFANVIGSFKRDLGETITNAILKHSKLAKKLYS